MSIETTFEIKVKTDEIISIDDKIALERFLKERLDDALPKNGIYPLEIRTDSYSERV